MGLQTITINMERPIASVTLQNASGKTPQGQKKNNISTTQTNTTSEQNDRQEQSADGQVQNLNQLCLALQDAIRDLKNIQQNTIKEHKNQIAKFSLEIARKVLMQKINKGDYQIESIIEQTLESAPTAENAIVHLNPQDLELLQKTQKENQNSNLKDIKLVSDKKISRAQCLIETPKGTVEAVIEDHLEKISKALEKVE